MILHHATSQKVKINAGTFGEARPNGWSGGRRQGKNARPNQRSGLIFLFLFASRQKEKCKYRIRFVKINDCKKVSGLDKRGKKSIVKLKKKSVPSFIKLL